jgi:predicted molibdopterin-dependent oxidoreductase YjgC
MPTEALFRRLKLAPNHVRIEFEGALLTVPAGISVAAALLAHNVGHTRESPVNGRPGAPYCMMGVCFECLVEVNGRANCQACLMPVEDGMRVRRQRGARDLLITDLAAGGDGDGDE